MITLPLSEGLHVSFCGLYIAVSRNHSVQNSPWGGGGSIASLRSITYELQSGFRSRFSTETCLTYMYLTNFIRYQTSKGLYTGMILLDLQKAFDTIDHLVLCDKLQAICMCSVDWFKSYLSGRNKFVQVNDTYSDSFPINFGVPQGSI